MAINYDELAQKHGGTKYDDLATKYGGSPVSKISTDSITPKAKIIGIKDVANFLTRNEQAFGKDIAQAIYLNTGGQQTVDEITKNNFEAGSNLVVLAKRTANPERRKKLLSEAAEAFSAAGVTQDAIAGVIKSNEQMLGDAGGVLLDILASGTYGKATQGAKSFSLMRQTPTIISEVTKGVGVGQGILEGAKAGIKSGGLFGAGYGATSGMQENKDLGGVAGSAVGGGVGGAIGGGIIGGAIGGISGGIQSKMLKVQEQKRALEQTMGQLNKKEGIAMSGEGNVVKDTFGRIVRTPNNREIEVAQTVSPLVDKNIIMTQKNIKNEIFKTSVEEIIPYLKENGNPLNNKARNELVNRLKTIEPLDITKADPVKQKTFNLFMDRVKSAVANTVDDLDLYRARITLDGIIDKQTGGKVFDEGGRMIPSYEAYLEARQVINQFIAERVPSGKTEFLGKLKYERMLYEALEGIKENIWKKVGKNPAMIKAIERIGKMAGTGAIVGTGYAILDKLRGK